MSSDQPGPVGAAAGPAGAPTSEPAPVRLVLLVRGHVQGVGFRWWTRARALELALVGSATNLADGGVEIVAEGPRAACERLVHLVATVPAPPVPPDAHRTWLPRPGRVDDHVVQWHPARGAGPGFVER